MLQTPKKLYKAFVFGLACLFAFPLYAQIELIGKASKENVRVNERFQLGFYVNIEGDTRNIKIDEFLELPKLDDLQVIGVMDKRNMSMSNNRVINQIGQEIMVVAGRKGTIQIGSARVTINGKSYTSNPFTIQVGGNVKTPVARQGQRLEGAFVAAEVSNDEPFMNEAVVLTLKFYARDYTILQRRGEFIPPSFKDFVVERYPTKGRNLKQERLNGAVYVSEVLARYILFPKKAGKTTIPSFGLDLVLNNAFRSEKFRLNSPELSIEARSLPSNAPKNFAGAVGQFELLVDVDKQEINQNESVNYGVELLGDGNLNMISLPELDLPDEIEVYKPKKRSKYQTTSSGIQGKIAAEYVLVPQYGGSYSLKPFQFTYFDPKEEAFKTLESRTLKLEVEGDPPPKKIAKNNAAPVAKTPLTVKDSLNEKSAGKDRVARNTGADSTLEPTVPKESSLFDSKWVWALFGLGSLALLAAIVYLEKRSRSNPSEEAKVTATSPRAFKQSLLPSIRALEVLAKENNAAAFMPQMEDILSKSAGFATQTEPGHFAMEEVEKKLRKNFELEEVLSWGKLMRTAKAAQYAPQGLSAADLSGYANKTEELANYFITNS